MLSVIIPAHNEATLIESCLRAVLVSDLQSETVEVIVVANGCSDDTADRARGLTTLAQQKGVGLRVMELEQGGKLAALNAGDAAAWGDCRAYLDADVMVSPPLLAQIAQALQGDGPIYASGQVNIPTPESWASRAYRRFYLTVPFMAQGVPGCGLFAVNRAGRALWGAFPDIISDDTFVRLCFTPKQRVAVAATYDWPLVEGFANLVRVRRRQNQGVDEIYKTYPELVQNDDKSPYALAALTKNALRHPLGFLTYASVALFVRFGSNKNTWSRGR